MTIIPTDLQNFQEHFKYDPTSGKITNKTKRGSRTSIGKESGWINSQGYRYLKFKDKSYGAHRIAWLLHYGEWPAHEVDHINHDRADNRIENLRDVPRHVNAHNLSLHKNVKSGKMGVHKDRDIWVAQIEVKGETIRLGRFKELKDAIKAREEGELKYKFHPNHGGK